MRRVILSVVGTVAGVVALLSFKTEGQVSNIGGLPSAGLPQASPATGASTSAPPDPRAPSTSSSSSAPATARTAAYTGAAEQTRYGVVQVKITVSGKRITNVGFVKLEAFDERSQQINSGAAPILLRETLTAQSAHIDSVSGASYTSEGYLQSLQSALDAAGIQ